MNNINIEAFNNKQFDIFGTTFTIKLVDTLDADDNLLHYGLTKGNIKEVIISRKVIKAKQPDSELYLTLVHEIVHIILDTGQWLEESGNEALLKQDVLCK